MWKKFWETGWGAPFFWIGNVITRFLLPFGYGCRQVIEFLLVVAGIVAICLGINWVANLVHLPFIVTLLAIIILLLVIAFIAHVIASLFDR